jgi:hypothetical protein
MDRGLGARSTFGHAQAVNPRLTARATRARRSYAAALAALATFQFFLPYVPDSRLRVDVLTGYFALAVSPFLFRGADAGVVKIYALSALSSAWCLLRVLLNPDDFLASTMVVTNHSFALLGVSLALLVRPRPGMLEAAAKAIWIVSLVTNLVALEQWRDSSSLVSQFLYDQYGGAFEFDYDYASSAEFQVLYAGRHTGIFNGMHALAIFNIVVIMLSLGGRFPRQGAWLRMLAMGLAVVGGVLAASKTFYLGAAVGVGLLILFRRISFRQVWPGIVASLLLATLVIQSDRDSIVSMYYEHILRLDPEWIFSPRFGSTGNLYSTIEAVQNDLSLLLLGRGAQLDGLNTADNAYLPLILVGGLLHLVLFYLPYLALMRSCWQERNANPWAAPFFAIYVTFFAMGLGIPTFQLGRITALLVLLTFFAFRSQSTAQPVSTARPLRA